MGYPVIDCAHDGSFVLSKPEGTGGLIDPAAVAEQVLYEVGDPANYLMPDVTCDFRTVRTEWAAPGQVRVSACAAGTRRPLQGQRDMAGRLPDQPDDGDPRHRCARQARRTADALIQRTRAMLAERGWPDYSETIVELLGCESQYGPHARQLPTREWCCASARGTNRPRR